MVLRLPGRGNGQILASTSRRAAWGRPAGVNLEGNMAKKSPWHSTRQNVHHVCTNCNTGNNIEKENLRDGTGGKPLCAECQRLIDQGRC